MTDLRSPGASRPKTTSRGFPEPTDYYEKLAHGRTDLLVLRISRYERDLLRADKSGVVGRFCLAKNLDGSYDLVKYADA